MLELHGELRVRTEERGGRLYLTEVHYIDGEINANDLRVIAAALRGIIAAANAGFRPDGGPNQLGEWSWPDDGQDKIPGRPGKNKAGNPAFYARVAQRYMELSQTTHHPNKVIAEETGVPLATVQRWTRKARQYGFLPPGRWGAAG
jgi:hypothetical protein